MAEASMIAIFNSKVSEFNKAVKANDREAISEIAVAMLRIALDECLKPNVSPTIKETYRKQSLSVVAYLASFASAPPVAVQSTAGGGEGSNDPYYVKKKWFSDEVPDLNFTNIIGVQEVKDAFMVDIVAPLRPEFQEFYRLFRGDQIGTQLLLYGPPGTGKTFIIKCLAGALNCKIAIISISEVLASVVGIAEKNIRDIFEEAQQYERCVIFFDEIDGLCGDRSSDDARNTKAILTTLLTCMDGFMKSKRDDQLRIIVGATNLPWKLDAALKRGGRFEKQIYVPLPDEIARKKFIEEDLNKIPHDADVQVDMLVKMLDGYSGADIKAIMRQISNKPLRRAVVSVMNGDKQAAYAEKVTSADCAEVIKSYINSVNSEMLLRYEAYSRGISYEDLLKRLKEAK